MADLGKTLMRLPREYKKGDVIEVKTMIIHPNHNGRRQLFEGAYLAEYYIRSIDVYYGDDHVLSVRPSSALSQNPYFTFHLRADKSAPVRVEWVDTKDQRYSHSEEVRV